MPGSVDHCWTTPSVYQWRFWALTKAFIFTNRWLVAQGLHWNMGASHLSCLPSSHYEGVGVSNHQPRNCLLNCSFKAQIKENTKAPRHWPLCGEFTGDRRIPAQRPSNAENVSIWWRHHGVSLLLDWILWRTARAWIEGFALISQVKMLFYGKCSVISGKKFMLPSTVYLHSACYSSVLILRMPLPVTTC